MNPGREEGGLGEGGRTNANADLSNFFQTDRRVLN